MPFSILRVRPGGPGDYGTMVKYVGTVPDRDRAIREIVKDFEDTYDRQNPDSLGGHLEIHEVRHTPK